MPEAFERLELTKLLLICVGPSLPPFTLFYGGCRAAAAIDDQAESEDASLAAAAFLTFAVIAIVSLPPIIDRHKAAAGAGVTMIALTIGGSSGLVFGSLGAKGLSTIAAQFQLKRAQRRTGNADGGAGSDASAVPPDAQERP